MRRYRPRLVACGAVALLLVLALVGCRSHDATPQSVAPAVTLVPSNASPSTPGTPGAEPTVDAVASELDQINSLINDINNALQPSDTSPDSGE